MSGANWPRRALVLGVRGAVTVYCVFRKPPPEAPTRASRLHFGADGVLGCVRVGTIPNLVLSTSSLSWVVWPSSVLSIDFRNLFSLASFRGRLSTAVGFLNVPPAPLCRFC